MPIRISVEETLQRLHRGEPFTFVDSRNPRAWGSATHKLPGALRVPADAVDQHLSEIPSGHVVVAYCT